MGRTKRLGFSLITVLGVWFVCELIVASATAIAPPPLALMSAPELLERYRPTIERMLAGEVKLNTFSPSLGWTVAPSGEHGPVKANGQGLRANHDYDQDPPIDRIRVATFGDSFTLGAEVELDQTWQVGLERLAPELEVLNFGVSGYGSDQALLRYQEDGRRFGPRLVILGFMSENINRLVNVFRPFYLPITGHPLTKPRFRLVDGELELMANPLPTLDHYRRLLDRPRETLAEIGRHDFFYQRFEQTRSGRGGLALPSLEALRSWNRRRKEGSAGEAADRVNRIDFDPAGEAFQIQLRIIERFRHIASLDGASSLVLLMPIEADLELASTGVDVRYQPLARALEERGIPHLDLAPAFLRAGRLEGSLAGFFAPQSHYSARGNALAAAAIDDALRRRGLISPLPTGEPGRADSPLQRSERKSVGS